MHGKAKIKTSVSEQEKKKKEREAKVKLYKQIMVQIWDKRRKEEYDEEGMSLITEVLSRNPDIYTLWNFRRQILTTYLSTKESEELSKVLISELSFTESCIKVNPKSYSAWHHRQWLMSSFPSTDLNKELQLCTLFLKMDDRNFHCWDYRRWVATRLNVPDEKELDYTMDKINENFSNYSSWHYRSKLLPRVYPDPAGIRPISEHMHLNELELVVNAAFTDPNDQSGWFYLRWLLGRLEPPIQPIRALVTSDQRLLIAFSSPVSMRQIRLGNTATFWSQLSPCILVKESYVVSEEGDELDIFVGDTKHNVKLLEDQDTKLYSWSNKQGIIINTVSPGLSAVLHDQLNMCNQLLDYEPESKWTLLTSVHIMVILDRHKYKETIMKRLKLLQDVDPTRLNYYTYLVSKYTMEYNLEDEKKEFLLSCTNLKCLVHTQYLLLSPSVNLTENQLDDSSLGHLLSLQSCKKLKLDGNKISSIKNMPRLLSLESLSISQNNIQNFHDVLPHLSKFPQLKFIDLSQNPVCNIDRPSLAQFKNIEFIMNS